MLDRYSRIRLALNVIVAAAWILTACSSPPAGSSATQQAKIALENCQLSATGFSARLAAKCGTLTVPEDRQSGSGRQIDLNIAVIEAISRNPAPDPLFFLTGGPGQAATESYLQLSGAFDRINQKRDIILVDQRGTGKSNPLECAVLDAPEEISAETEDLVKFAQGCLEDMDSNLAMYTTPVAVEDLDAVRAALGYEQINIYGLSYGTRVALAYLRQYPDHVRAAVLDGIVPMDEVLGMDVARDAQRAVDLILERCKSDTECSQAFPNVQEEFSTLFQKLQEAPVDVSLVHPVTGEDTQVTLTYREFASAVRLLTYTPETVALLPLLIHNASSKDDYSLLAAQYLFVSSQLTDSISEGMGYSVLCSEDVPFIDPDEARQLNEGTYLGTAQTDALAEICSVWPRGDLQPDYKQPVESNVPVLLLSGEADPVTPPENGERVARTLPNSLHLVASGQGHNVLYRGCLPRIVTSFIENGSTANLDTACVDDIQPVPFFISFSGPKP